MARQRLAAYDVGDMHNFEMVKPEVNAHEQAQILAGLIDGLSLGQLAKRLKIPPRRAQAAVDQITERLPPITQTFREYRTDALDIKLQAVVDDIENYRKMIPENERGLDPVLGKLYDTADAILLALQKRNAFPN